MIPVSDFFIKGILLLLALLLVSVNVYAVRIYQNGIPSPQLTIPQNRCYYVRKYNKKIKHHYFVQQCPQLETAEEILNDCLKALTPQQRLALHKQLEEHYGIFFYEPTYVLPFYYTGRPYEWVYRDTTPDNQRVLNEELKGQLSFRLPLWLDMFNSKLSLNMYYTQLSYWQLYAKSQYFRETDYEPALYFSYPFSSKLMGWFGAVHQSNGRGGNLERSWNRLFVDMMYSYHNFFLSIRPWVLIFTAESSDLHDSDIARYLGYERIVVAYKFYRQEVSLMLGNTIESGFHRGAIELDYSFPIHGVLHGYVQFFSGYGQSLIEYNHYTNSVGVGIIINNWI